MPNMKPISELSNYAEGYGNMKKIGYSPDYTHQNQGFLDIFFAP